MTRGVDSLSPVGKDIPRVRLDLLGSFDLRVGSEPVVLPMNAQRLVSFLALHDRTLLRAYVAGSLWGETTDFHSGGSLRSALWRIGSSDYALIDASSEHISLSPTVSVDLRDSVALAHRVLNHSRDLTEADLDGEALSKDLLPDWSEDWVLIRREGFHQLRLRALETLCQRLTARKQFGLAVQTGIAAVAGEPLRESARRVLISAHIGEGNIAAALAQYEAFRELLWSDLKLEPSPQLRDLVAPYLT